ncbi:MAG: MFS transporter [Polyangiaceae bacterium]|nr:MFS transporter [Myxococcales bacterium]MCB9588041.1 MFS transporter [Polyangiaceae bacterium]MCB9610650.1 MFS transporter [Polyangiaceae bacterium]
MEAEPSNAIVRGGQLRRALALTCLIIAGEAVFGLPFHLARFFRPTVLAVLGLTNTELGEAQAVYGVLAMLAYFPGGPLADRFSANKLLAVALWMTGLGGFYFATFPSYHGMAWLFGYWGVTTILLFWAALIRATRDWGGEDKQGRAYGILDGGRGLFAALLASAAALLFQLVFPADEASVTPEQRAAALRSVIYVYTLVTLLAGVLAWLFAPRSERAAQTPGNGASLELIREVIRLPQVWLQALIVVAAYVAYKGFDNYSLYAHEVHGMSEVEVSRFTASMQWVRPVAAIGAGFLADRLRGARVILGCFVLLLATDLYFALAVPGLRWILYGNVLVTCTAMFGLRGVYFAVFAEAKVPWRATGTAVGVVSVIGYTPDIFVAWVAGVLLDGAPGLAGHQHFFWFLAAFSLLGVLATLAFMRLGKDRVA